MARAMAVALHVQCALVYVLVVYHVSQFVIIPMRYKIAQDGLRQICMDTWKRLCDTMSRRRSPAGTLAEAVKEQVDEFRVVQCERCVRYIVHVLGMGIAFVTVRSHLRAASMSKDDDFKDDEAHVLFMGFMGLMYFGHLLIASGWVKLANLHLHILYGGMMCATTAYVAQMSDDPRYLKLLGVRCVMRMAMSILYLDYVRATFWNVILSSVTVWRYPHNTVISFQEGEEAEEEIWSFVYAEILVCIGVALFSFIVQSWLEARVRLQLSTQNQKRATQRFASCQCDAVFWLAPDLRLNGPAPKLAHMLVMPEAPNHLDGRCFQSFFATDSDRVRFEDFLVGSISCLDADGLPALFHADLSDSTGRVFPVEMFHTWFVDNNDQVGHLIGISEPRPPAEEHAARTEEEQGQCELTEASDLDQPFAEEPTIIGRQAHNDESATSAPAAIGCINQRSSASTMPSLMTLILEHRAVAPIAVVFDAYTYEIVGCTAAFATFVGSIAVATRIEDIIVNFREFEGWMQHWGNLIVDTDRKSEPFRITLALKARETRTEVLYSANAFLIGARTNVSVSELGVQVAEQCRDTKYDFLCVLELENVEVEWPDQDKHKKPIADDGILGPTSVTL